ncbi:MULTISPECIES: amino acid permease [unclassified Arcicella]|uniref:APC family permease n=1 Tax=unclassified Arcicella TaxID=2644986 RepID=UPI002855A3F3|nr:MULTISPECIES: amino acid permease [unclassified Arcicella]MDR6562742.1 APA family basic amino acid/polyamine antiporter [Arcicella sp. BE51]MDR6812913.1 APA family basic amino acid/polyamine antiporter [Arcicella sp. BE140]MDR6824227.1 APA family basic amino acid/polyamine antiporter [Arcicella sp. BE139]
MKSSPPNQGKLVRSIGLTSAVVLIISSVIGTGVFKKVAPMSAELQSPSLVLIAWLVAGLISLAGTLSNAEVASMLADSGGEFVYFRKIYNRFFAFLFGWTNFAVIRTASIASIAYVFAQSLNSVFPFPITAASLADVSFFGLHPLDNLSVKLVAIALIIFLTYFNYKGLKLGENLSRVLTALMTTVMLLIIVLGLLSSVGSFENITTNSVRYSADAMSGATLFKALALACLSAFWGYEGWASVGFIGGEMKNPQRNLPLALIIGTLIIMVLYMSMNFVYLYILPIDEFIKIYESKNGIAAVAVVSHFLGAWGGMLISGLILVTTFNCASTTLLLASRLFYAMAHDKMFFKSVDYIHPVYNTPSRALFIQAIWTSLLVLSGTFDQLTDMLIFAAFIFYGATAFGVFVLRKKMPDAHRPYKVIGYPVVPAIFVLFCIVLIVNTLIEKPEEALSGLGLMATGLPFYYYWTKKKE